MQATLTRLVATSHTKPRLLGTMTFLSEENLLDNRIKPWYPSQRKVLQDKHTPWRKEFLVILPFVEPPGVGNSETTVYWMYWRTLILELLLAWLGYINPGHFHHCSVPEASSNPFLSWTLSFKTLFAAALSLKQLVDIDGRCMGMAIKSCPLSAHCFYASLLKIKLESFVRKNCSQWWSGNGF